MKKKIISVMLAACMTAMVIGCGTNEEAASQEAETVEETPEDAEAEEPAEEEAPEAPVYEEVTYEVAITEVDGEAGTWKAFDAQGQEYLLTAADTLPEEEKALLAAGAGVKVTTEVEAAKAETEEMADEAETTDENAEGTEAVETKEIRVTKVEALGETESYELSQAVELQTLGYTVEDMADTQMYAKSGVNVRKGPSADDEKLGTLSTAEEVTVTGLTSTNWYRIKYDDESAFVSAEYLQNEKPVVQTASSTGASGSSGGGASSSAAQPTEADSFLVYSEAEIMEAYNSGDYQRMAEMNQANVDAFDAKWGTNWGSSSAQQTGQPASSGGSAGSGDSGVAVAEKSTSTSGEFADYLNQKRSEEGLAALSWSDSLAGVATARAEEIVDDYSHNGSRDCSSEIILKTSSGDPASWYDSFYNSATHRVSMLGNYNKVGAAVCHSGNYYYVVMLFDY